MSVPYPTANFGHYPDFTAQYSSNLELLLQQLQSVLRPHVSEQGGLVGKMASPVTQYSSITMKAPRGRFSPIEHVNPLFRCVHGCSRSRAKSLELIDSFDKLQTIVDPTLGLRQSGRCRDRALLGRWHYQCRDWHAPDRHRHRQPDGGHVQHNVVPGILDLRFQFGFRPDGCQTDRGAPHPAPLSQRARNGPAVPSCDRLAAGG